MSVLPSLPTTSTRTRRSGRSSSSFIVALLWLSIGTTCYGFGFHQVRLDGSATGPSLIRPRSTSTHHHHRESVHSSYNNKRRECYYFTHRITPGRNDGASGRCRDVSVTMIKDDGDDNNGSTENPSTTNKRNNNFAITQGFLSDENTSISSIILLLTPAVTSSLAFIYYKTTSESFHIFVDVTSGHTWSAVDGGEYLTDLITPALTGVVASFISLLFGTLTSMTVGNLYVRQATMSKLLSDTFEDLRLLELHISSLFTKSKSTSKRKTRKTTSISTKEIGENDNDVVVTGVGSVVADSSSFDDIVDDDNYQQRAQDLVNAYGGLMLFMLQQGSLSPVTTTNPKPLDEFWKKISMTTGNIDNDNDIDNDGDQIGLRQGSTTTTTTTEIGRYILEELMSLFHEISDSSSSSNNNDSGDDDNDGGGITKKLPLKLNERVIGQAYDTLNRLIQTRSNLITNYETYFPLWHYGNLCILALAICFIFLTLTDKPALLFLGGFQLRICWAMLIGTFSMLAVVIYDLNSILSGTFQVRKKRYLQQCKICPLPFGEGDVEELCTSFSFGEASIFCF